MLQMLALQISRASALGTVSAVAISCCPVWSLRVRTISKNTLEGITDLPIAVIDSTDPLGQCHLHVVAHTLLLLQEQHDLLQGVEGQGWQPLPGVAALGLCHLEAGRGFFGEGVFFTKPAISSREHFALQQLAGGSSASGVCGRLFLPVGAITLQLYLLELAC